MPLITLKPANTDYIVLEVVYKGSFLEQKALRQIDLSMGNCPDETIIPLLKGND